MSKHQARGLRSLPQDLPDLGQRLGTLTPCPLGVWPFHYTGTAKSELTRLKISPFRLGVNLLVLSLVQEQIWTRP